MPSWWVRMSTATYREANASQSEYFGFVSSVGSEVRQVMTHRNSLGFVPPTGVGRKRAFRRFATYQGVCWCNGVPKPGGAEGAANRGSNHDKVVTGLFGMKSGWQRRTSLRRMCTSEATWSSIMR